MSDNRSVAVIITTYNRNELLRDTLEQLIEQDYDSFCAYVIDDSDTHTEETTKFLNDLPDNFIYEHRQNPDGGLCGARNRGIRLSNEDVLIFIDDDVELAEGFIRAHAQSYTGDEVGAVAGQVLSAGNPEPLDVQPVGYTTWYGRSITRLYANQSGNVEEGRGCNMSFRRTAIEATDGFDTSLDYFDETDVFHRIKSKGWDIEFNPEASVYHHSHAEGGTVYGSQPSRETFEQMIRNKSYFQLKNMPLYTFPFSVFTSILFRVKQRKAQLHKLPVDLLIMMRAILSSVGDWKKKKM